MSTDDVTRALGGLLERFVRAHEAVHGVPPSMEHDPEDPSPCEAGPPDFHGFVPWRPVRRSEPGDWSGLEHALGVALHPNARAYYDAYWAGHLEARHGTHRLTLLQLWSPNDFERLQENLIGHALAKRRLRLPMTVFFATSRDEEDLVWSVDNDSGRVVLERPGRPPHAEAAASLAEFIEELRPDPGE